MRLVASCDSTVHVSVSPDHAGYFMCYNPPPSNEHKKSVFSVAYLENMILVASCDSTVHVSVSPDHDGYFMCYTPPPMTQEVCVFCSLP